ncbi:tetratricopeptide repeat protein [Bacillus niameyensis]|uniref:tetratricopeptide repeat protein n=1 Tax=Bacillus niameyensis TaxID=1522308 RepID=UPI000ACFAE31|nr:tetratricopeptide repeat protein [Bacillus niameyensis]
MRNRKELNTLNAAEIMIKLIEEQKFSEAKIQFNKVIASGSDEERFFLAEELARYGYLEEAKSLYEILLESYPDEGELKLGLAELLIEMDLDDQAYPYLQSITPDDPNYPAALLLEADLYEMQGLYEVSENKLLHAKEIVPDEPIVDFALGELYMTQGRFLEATRCFSSLLHANKNELANIDINSRMAEALSAGGAFEEALPYYEKSLKNKLDSNTLFGFGLTSYQAGQYQKSIQAFKQLREMDPDYHSLYLYLAKSYEHEEKLAEALEAVTAGMTLDDFNKELQFYGGKLALKLGDEEKAELFFRQALALDPEYVEAALTLNKLFLHQEKYEDVIDISQPFIQGAPDPQFYWDSAISLEKMENFEEALKQYQLAYNDFKNNQDFLVDYGYFLLEEGRREEAIQIFKGLVQLNPNNEEWISVLDRLLDE